jgi:hypothetical protein
LVPWKSRLDLSNTAVTDAGLAALSRLPSLEKLSLGGTSVTDAGVKEVVQIERLRELELVSTNITDAGLKDLARLKGLRKLIVGGDSDVTRAAGADLKRALPGLSLQFAIVVRQTGFSATPLEK